MTISEVYHVKGMEESAEDRKLMRHGPHLQGLHSLAEK